LVLRRKFDVRGKLAHAQDGLGHGPRTQSQKIGKLKHGFGRFSGWWQKKQNQKPKV